MGTKNFTMGAYQDFVNLQAELYYLADIPLNAETLGMNGIPDLFMVNKPVYFRVTDDNNAKALECEVSAQAQSTGDIYTCSHSTNVFSIKLNLTDTYVVSIKAKNPMFDKTIQKTIRMFETVENFQIVEGNQKIKANEVKLLDVTFD